MFEVFLTCSIVDFGLKRCGNDPCDERPEGCEALEADVDDGKQSHVDMDCELTAG